MIYTQNFFLLKIQKRFTVPERNLTTNDIKKNTRNLMEMFNSISLSVK